MSRVRQHGAYTVEFAIVGLLFFVLLFGVLEMGRLLFTVNALNESARRGARLAAVCNIQDPRILRRAIFNDADQSGTSPLIGNLETSHLRLVYLNQDGAQVASPADTNGVTGYRAIRYVQLRIEGFPFELLIPTLQLVITLPTFQSTLPRESLGRHPEANVVPEITPC
ncbi:pilus assembly protein [Pseudomonas songnenensis]|uniref:Pilus assembly protein n=1 Tax=Pseudomonas songnenensis TaxID=1176259 RepID=A0ABX9UP35_9PSED|nr:TadE family protein [Pseudomonas songnenensis]MCQ4299418.1 pilus assembly protein [Pseudomonas songnenensis]RMH94299.1 pilus assembly protein [Pseudomonas songnenensis]